MKRKPDTDFEALLHSLAMSPDEAAWRDALKEKIKAHGASLFEENDTSENHNESCEG